MYEYPNKYVEESIKLIMKYLIPFLIIIISVIIMAKDRPEQDKIAYRPAVNADKFYPSNADTLKKMINDFLDLKSAKKIDDDDDEIIGLVSPHAGYVYSGWVAGKGYREVIGKKYDVIIVIAPNHFKGFRGASVYNGEAYTTPLGAAKVDLELSKEIAAVFPEIKYSNDGHEWNYSGNSEHSLEVQIPFLQIVQPDVPIVAISMAGKDFETIDLLTKAIYKAVTKLKRKPLLVASSDLSHYYDIETARAKDIPLVKTFERFDYFKLSYKCAIDEFEACGSGPIATVMMTSELLGANNAVPIYYSTSGNSPLVKSDKSQVVGYFSGALVKSKNSPDNYLPQLNDDDKEELLKIAIKSLNRATKVDTSKDLPTTFASRNLTQEFAAFVTYKKKGDLRGCIGHTISSMALVKEVEESARLAALNDTRFSPITKKELPDLEIEVTVLTRMKKILDENEIVPGRDGVYLRLGNYAGLFLPIVATEYGWDRKTLLEHLCNKANLPANSDKDPRTELYIFQAIYFDTKYKKD
jgi:MEMO1 family protein